MRGKFITTNLKLAVLAGSKKRLMEIEETKALLDNFQPIWTKDKLVLKEKQAELGRALHEELVC